MDRHVRPSLFRLTLENVRNNILTSILAATTTLRREHPSFRTGEQNEDLLDHIMVSDSWRKNNDLA